MKTIEIVLPTRANVSDLETLLIAHGGHILADVWKGDGSRDPFRLDEHIVYADVPVDFALSLPNHIWRHPGATVAGTAA